MPNSTINEEIYDHLFRAGSYTRPTWYISLENDGGEEVNTGEMVGLNPEYARVEVPTFPQNSPRAGMGKNPDNIDWATPLTMWRYIPILRLWDAASAGSEVGVYSDTGRYSGINWGETQWIDHKAHCALIHHGTLVADETITIDGVVYKWVTSVSAPYDVAISGGLPALGKAINGGAGAGSDYGTGTVAHPRVEMVVDLFVTPDYDPFYDSISSTFFSLIRYRDGATGTGAGVEVNDFENSGIMAMVPRMQDGGETFRLSPGNFVLSASDQAPRAVEMDTGLNNMYGWFWEQQAWHVPVPNIALYTTMPAAGDSGGVEVSGGSYARQSLVGVMGAISGNIGSNSTDIDFGTASAAWGDVVGYVVRDQYDPGGGAIDEPMVAYVFASAFTVASSDTFKFAAGDLKIKMLTTI